MEHTTLISTWIPVLLLWFIIFLQFRKKKQVKKLIKNRLEGVNPMEEIVKKFMGIPVSVSCIENDFTVPTGVITSYNDGWITLKALEKEEETAINCNYVVSIKPIKVKQKKVKNK